MLATSLGELDPELRFERVLGMDMLGGPQEAEDLLSALTKVLGRTAAAWSAASPSR